MSATKGSLAVSSFVRLKPNYSNTDAVLIAVDPDGESITVDGQRMQGFSAIIKTIDDQKHTYEQTCHSILDSFLDGYNATLFCFGQTGSGKTHTLFGPPNSFNPNSLLEANETFEGENIPSTWGVFPRSVLRLLAKMGTSSSISATAVEIYLDNCYDLMNEKVRVPIAGYGRSIKTTMTRDAKMKTRRDSSGKWIPPCGADGSITSRHEAYETSGAKSITIASLADLLQFMTIIDTNRSSKSHNLNARSSRSHCIITVVLNGRTSPKGKLMMVDLAGSERIVKSGAEGMAASEAKNINTSLTALGRVITALRKRAVYVPYRDSSLTMLLKQSLGGNCVTSVVVTVTEDPDMSKESLSTLQFGQRCARCTTKKIKPPNFSVEGRIRNAHLTLAAVDTELATMEAAGFSGGLNTDHPAPTRKAFTENQEKMKRHASKVLAIKAKLSAHKSSQSTNTSELHNLESSLKHEESQAYNLKGILLRSMTTGVWNEPSKGYLHKLMQRKGLVAELVSMGENVDVPELSEPLQFKNLLNGFHG